MAPESFTSLVQAALAIFGFVGTIMMAYAHMFIDKKLSLHERTILSAIRADYSRKDLTEMRLHELERRIDALEEAIP
jgi:hypothetical protein